MGAKGTKTRDNLLTEEERAIVVEFVMTELKANPKLAITVLSLTGMRVGEFLHMRADWIDYRMDVIHIPAKQPCKCYDCRIENGRDYWTPKTEEGVRDIPMGTNIGLPLASMLQEFFKLHSAVMEVWTNRKDIWNILQLVKRKCRIKHKLFPHALRGSFAKELAMNGYSTLELQAIMGWKDPAMAGIYVKMGAAEIKSTYDKKAKLKWGK